MPRKKIDGLVRIFPEYSPIKISYKDVFSTRQFYKSIHEWLLNNQWQDTEGSGNQIESYYGQRTGRDGANETWIWWRTAKMASDNNWVKYYLDVDIHLIGIKDTEIVKDGKKHAVQKGKCEVVIRAYIEKLYKKEFKKNWFLRQMSSLWERRIYHESLDKKKKILYQESYALAHFVKQWFKLKRYLPYEEVRSFYPSKAYPSHIKEGQ
jgi:hypothetical protein